MTTTQAIAKLRTLGYDVGVAFEDAEGVKVYTVSGFGVLVYVDAPDAAMWASLTNDVAHAERVEQEENGPPNPNAELTLAEQG